uniref:C-CAP/cofactor C-like domain-containing protein n=1 Tax=Acrobeloides nanus TaxID=290746 RepID=A0A914CGG4_9BILA
MCLCHLYISINVRISWGQHSVSQSISNLRILGLQTLVSILIRLANENDKDFLNYVLSNIGDLCCLLLICDETMLRKYIQTPEFHEFPPHIDCKIPIKILKNFDLLFEGSIIQQSRLTKISCAHIQAMKCSEIFAELWPNLSYFNLNDLTSFFKRKLQNDIFVLNKTPLVIDTPRRITSTQLAKHRKLSIYSWHRMELLTNPSYRGANLRVFGGTPKSSWLFHPQFLSTALISDCNGCCPIVLGPVQDLVVIQRVKNCHISVICRRIIVTASENVVIFVNTPTPPIVIGNCEKIQFAPYNVYYDVLEFELHKSGLHLLTNETNFYKAPTHVSCTRKKSTKKFSSKNYFLISKGSNLPI